MEIVMKDFNQEKLKRAKKRVDEIKAFYIHLAVYLVINIFILVKIYLNTDNFWKWGHFLTLFFWGIGVAFHGAKVFGYSPLFSKSWEERQIKKYMDKDRDDSQKFI